MGPLAEGMTDVTEKLGRHAATGLTCNLQNCAPFRTAYNKLFLSGIFHLFSECGWQQLIKTVNQEIKTEGGLPHCKVSPKEPSLCPLQGCPQNPSSAAVVEPTTHAVTVRTNMQLQSRALQGMKRPCHLCHMVPTLSWLLQLKLFDRILSVLIKYLTTLRDPKRLSSWHISLSWVHNPENYHLKKKEPFTVCSLDHWR